MRSTINPRTNVVVVGNRQGRNVVVGTDRSHASAHAHRLVTGLLADFSATPGSSATDKTAPKAKPTADMRRAAAAAWMYCARGRHAGIPARQSWQRSERFDASGLPPAFCRI